METTCWFIFQVESTLEYINERSAVWIRLHVAGQSTTLKDEGNRLPRGSIVQLLKRYICSTKVEQPWYHLDCIQMKHSLEVRSVRQPRLSASMSTRAFDRIS